METSRRALLGGLGLAPLIAASTVRAQQEGGDRIDAFVRGRMEAKRIPGAGVAVVRDGRILKQAGYGDFSLDLGLRATADSVFPMASSSKLLAGLAAGRLVEAGLLDLDAPARTYLPALPEALAGVRVHHLLSHTSGLAGLGANPAFSAERAQRERREAYVGDLRLDFFTDEELLAYGAAAGLSEPPGTRWRYSQFPFFLFGMIVARLSGRSYADHVAQKVFRPLGIARAAYGDHRALVPGRSPTNYTRQFGPLQNLALRYTPAFWPAAGLNMSTADAARLLGGFEPGRLLRGETLRRLWRRARLNDGSEANYGLAFTVTTTSGRTWVGHEGGGCSYVGWWPEQRLGIAILFNLSGSGEDGIERALADVILG
ncbi:MAG TPA: serine hydrolase domain-containing protein [Allosphingosinicella sp.]|nr:serine hydrolase domain-containing protein [Allosphingosinicella sp.]